MIKIKLVGQELSGNLYGEPNKALKSDKFVVVDEF